MKCLILYATGVRGEVAVMDDVDLQVCLQFSPERLEHASHGR